MTRLTRRTFMQCCSSAALSALAGCGVRESDSTLDDFIQQQMRFHHIPGLAVTAVHDGAVVLSRGFGWSNIEQRVPMTPDAIQNIGSTSKPVVTTVIMQCVERGLIQLDDNINDHLPLPILNPHHPATPITVMQLLTHRSSLADGSSYGHGYQCGASEVPLQRWIDGYFQPGGEFFDVAENFHAWAPGEQYEYNNVAFALLAYLVQVVTNRDFDHYCREELFEPLGMENTTWLVSNVDKEQHVTPYARVSNGEIDSPSWGGVDLALINGEIPPAEFEGLFADCIYDHPNFADGFLRTSANDMAMYQLMLLGGGQLNGARVLKESSVRLMFSGEGITWSQRELPNGLVVWNHGGGDPGVSALFDFRPGHGDGVIVFANTHGAKLDAISAYLFSVVEDFLD
ncbi:MAG: serine hydrolase domain-containing protein [Woeseiaceae bacterium]